MVPEDDTRAAEAHRQFLELLETSHTRAAEVLVGLHPGDAAEWLGDAPAEDAWPVFDALDSSVQATLLEHASGDLRERLVGRMSVRDLRDVVAELPSDEAVDLLGETDRRTVEDVLRGLDAAAAQELRALGAYDPDTAGGLMATEVVTVPLGSRVGDAIKAIRRLGPDAQEELGVFIVDDEGRPVGYLSDRALLSNPIHGVVDEVMVQPFTVEAGTDQEVVARTIDKYGLQSVGVVDGAGALIGVISAEDAAEVIAEEADEDIALIVGTSVGRQQTRLGVATRVRQRLPLMGLTVLGGLASAKLLSIFTGAHTALDGTTEYGVADILRYLPLIIGLAGNVGVQSSTILVRAFATGEVDDEREFAVLVGEVAVGGSIGLICGVVVMFVASLIEAGAVFARFGTAVGVATAVAVGFAALMGSIVPATCKRLGIDPAIVAGPFLISLSDVAGSLIYIVTAKELLL